MQLLNIPDIFQVIETFKRKHDHRLETLEEVATSKRGRVHSPFNWLKFLHVLFYYHFFLLLLSSFHSAGLFLSLSMASDRNENENENVCLPRESA